MQSVIHKHITGYNSFLGVPLTKSLTRLVRVGVFRGTLRFRAAAVAALRPSHRPSLPYGRTSSTSRTLSAEARPKTISISIPSLSRDRYLHLMVLLMSLVITPACVRVEPPPDVLPPETMAALMADIYLLEGRRMGDKVLYADDVYIKEYYALIFQKHGITPAQYTHSHLFYTRYPDQFSKIFDRIIEILQQKQIDSESTRHNASEPPADHNF